MAESDKPDAISGADLFMILNAPSETQSSAERDRLWASRIDQSVDHRSGYKPGESLRAVLWLVVGLIVSTAPLYLKIMHSSERHIQQDHEIRKPD